MPNRKYKPTSSGRRHMTVSDFAEITKKKPLKALTEPIKKPCLRTLVTTVSTRLNTSGRNGADRSQPEWLRTPIRR